MEAPTLRRSRVTLATDSEGTTMAFNVDLVRGCPGDFHADYITIAIAENVNCREDSTTRQAKVEPERFIEYTVEFALQVHQCIDGIKHGGETKECYTDLLVTVLLLNIFFPREGR